MKYLILIHTNPASLEIWDKLSDEQRTEFGLGHLALSEALAESGELIVSEGLADPSLATYVSVREGQTMTSDGPFAEVKEHLAGFYLIECDGSNARSSTQLRYPTPHTATSRSDRSWI